MPLLFPTQGTLSEVFSSSYPFGAPKSEVVQPPRTKHQARSELYPAWSVVDDAKAKTVQLSDAAAQEFEKASSKAQAKAGKIELYSAKYYAACTFGGLMAC
ncbi:Cu/Pi carrier, partial [Cryomyces antarcticus]